MAGIHTSGELSVFTGKLVFWLSWRENPAKHPRPRTGTVFWFCPVRSLVMLISFLGSISFRKG